MNHSDKSLRKVAAEEEEEEEVNSCSFDVSELNQYILHLKQLLQIEHIVHL